MSSRGRILLLPVLTLLTALIASQPAFATNTYANYLGTNYDFTGIQETSTYGDAELPPAGGGTCCFDDPTGVGDSLYFTPPSFAASAAGTDDYDDPIGAQLQLTITAHAGSTIDILNIGDFGTLALSGPDGSGYTSVFATMVGFVTVEEVNFAPVTPVVISFNANGGNPAGVTGYFTPGTLGSIDGLTILDADFITSWNGIVSLNLASIAGAANATKVKLSFDNELAAYSEAASNSADIQKTSVVIGVIPEPGTFALLGAGLLALAIRARSRRA